LTTCARLVVFAATVVFTTLSVNVALVALWTMKLNSLFELSVHLTVTVCVLALRGALQLIRLPAAGRPVGETVRLLAAAMGLAKQADEKRTVLGLLQRYPSKEALDLATAYVNDSEVSAEAKAAVTRLERAVRR
jgi:hypothetical protein